MWLLMRMLMWLLMWLLMRLSMRLLHTRDTGLGGLAGTSLAHAHTALGAHTAAAALH
jgi:hypothetical protein